MSRNPLRVTAAVLAAGLACASGSSGMANDDDMSARYAQYQQEAARPSLLGRVTNRLGRNWLVARVSRFERYALRLTTGGLNPTNVATFNEDFAARSAALSRQIQAQSAHASATGQGVVVAVLDGGFDLTHEAIAANVLPYGFDAVEQDFDAHDPGNGRDDDGDGHTDLGVGHGTFVAAMVLTAAPEAQIIPVRIADDEGYGTSEELVSGIQFAIDMGADILNLSFEAGLLNHTVLQKIREAEQAGAIVVVSAGNDGNDSMKELAAASYTLSVAAVDDGDQVAAFSNTAAHHQELTIFAPGVDLAGPYAEGSAYCVWSGTSFAAPLVAGAVALRLQQDPGLTTQTARDVLRQASRPVMARDGSQYVGAGRVDLAQVVGQ